MPSIARTQLEASVPFVVPTPKRARLTEPAILSVGSCSMSVNAPLPLSSPPCLTSSAPYPRSWVELTRRMKSHVPTTQPLKSRSSDGAKTRNGRKSERTDTRFAEGEGQMGAGTEGTAKGEQSPYASKGGVALASTRSFHLPQGVSRERSPKLPQHQDPVPELPCPRVLCPGKDVRQAIVLGTMGRGFPVFRQYAHAAQTLIPSEAPLYSRQEGTGQRQVREQRVGCWRDWRFGLAFEQESTESDTGSPIPTGSSSGPC